MDLQVHRRSRMIRPHQGGRIIAVRQWLRRLTTEP